MCLSVISKPHRGGGLVPLGLSSQKKSFVLYINNKKVLVSRQHHELREFYRDEFNNFELLNNDTNVNIITDMSKSINSHF